MALTLLIGGARSGKSSLAVARGREHRGPVVFVATAEARDEEMAERIGRHRTERPAEWVTVEAPVEVEAALEGADPGACVIVDCLSLWVANLLERGEEVAQRTEWAARIAAGRDAPTIAVTNEVGMGIVPVNELARRYRDELGRANAVWAAHAAEAALVVAGRLLRLE